MFCFKASIYCLLLQAASQYSLLGRKKKKICGLIHSLDCDLTLGEKWFLPPHKFLERISWFNLNSKHANCSKRPEFWQLYWDVWYLVWNAAPLSTAGWNHWPFYCLDEYKVPRLVTSLQSALPNTFWGQRGDSPDL